MSPKNNSKIAFIYHADYKTGIDTNYSITFGFLEKYFPSNYIVIKHSLYNGGETRIYPKCVKSSYKEVPIIGKIPVPFRYLFETVFSFFYLLIGNYNVVIALNPLSALAPCVLRILRKECRVFFINPDFSTKRFDNILMNKFYFFVDKFSTKYCSKNICNSIHVINYKKELYSDLNLEGKFFHMPNIPNPWVIDTFIHTKKVSNRIIYVGGVGTQLDFEKIIDVVNKLKQVSADVHLLVVGDGNRKSYLEEYIKQNKIDNVKFLGVLSHQDTLKEIAKSEFGIALYNGSLNFDEFRDSCKIREYQALSCIPITTDIVRSNYEEIRDNDSGIIVKDVGEMKEELSSLLKNEGRKQNLMENSFGNYKFYVTKYDDFYKLITTED